MTHDRVELAIDASVVGHALIALGIVYCQKNAFICFVEFCIYFVLLYRINVYIITLKCLTEHYEILCYLYVESQ